MAAITYKSFTGEIPRMEAHLLPDNAAVMAQNCTFESGAIVPLNDLSAVATLVNNPIRGLFTLDGLLFYSWTQETYAFRSPFYQDTIGRMFYLQPSVGRFKAASLTELTTQLPSNGISPTLTWNVGVPQPTQVPSLTLIPRNTLPDYPSYSVTAEAWWTSLGVVYNKTSVSLSTVTIFKKYGFTVPTNSAVPTDEQSSAILNVRLTFRDTGNNNDIASFLMVGNDTARSSGFPGTVEANLTGTLTSGGACYVELKWGPTGTYSYTYVYENTWNEEGPAATAAQISPSYIEDVLVQIGAGNFTGYVPFLRANIYRTFGVSTTYIKANVTGTFPAFLDSSSKAANMGAALESAEWFPPVAGLQGICQSANEWFAAFKDNTVYMSQPGRPHAWPYSQTFPTAVVGICPGEGCIVVTTYDGIWMIVGVHPASTTQIRATLPQAGIAQRSMTGVDGAVVFASNDGLPLVIGGSATMKASEHLFTRKSWKALFGPSLADASLELDYHDGMIVGQSRNRAAGFIIRMDEDSGVFVRHNFQFSGMFPVLEQDALYVTQGANVKKWRGSAGVTAFTWKSKEHILPCDASFGAGYIRCDGITVLTLFADGVQVFQNYIDSGRFRIPGGYKGRRWQIQLVGINPVRELIIAQSMRELGKI